MFKEKNYYRDERSIQRNSFWHRAYSQSFEKTAEDIMKGENIGEEEKEFISIIAILHDIGAVEAQKKLRFY